MELKVGKDKEGDKSSSLIDVAETNSAIRHNRNIVDILKSDYEEATTNEEKRDIGIAINSINSDIKSLRNDLMTVSLNAVVSVQKLEAEIGTLTGEIQSLENVKGTLAEDKDIIAIDNRIDDYARDILDRERIIEGMLPNVEGIHSAEDVASSVEVLSEDKRKEWFDNGDIKDDSMEIIKYGRPAGVRYERIPGTDELEEIRDERIVGVIEENIEKRTDAISSVGGVWTTVGETDTKKGTNISFSPTELITLAKIKTPDEMVARINAMCTVDQRKAFANALGDVDKDGNLIDPGMSVILEKANVVCNVPNQEIYDAFHRMKELDAGVPGSGYEYMQLFLKRMLRYGAFEDDVYDDMAAYDSVDDLLDRIGKEIRSCSCTINDTHEDAVRIAFGDRESLESMSKGKGIVFMNRALRNIFNCDTFEDHVYKDISEYEDPEILINRINTELSNSGVYDKDVLKYAMSGVNRRAVLNKEIAAKQLDDVFGDHFTKQEYEDAAKHVMSEDSVIDSNRSALIKRFRTIGKEGQILSGKILEGITNEEYNERWNKEEQKMIKHGETKNIDAIILKRKLAAAQKQFGDLVSGIDDDCMSSRDEIRYMFKSVGLQDYVVSNLATSITDLDYVVDDNIQKLSRGMKSLIKKHDMYEEDIFRESSVYDAIEKRAKMNLGDSKGALAHMKDSILESVGKLDMTKYGDSITNAMSEKINADYGDIDEKSLVNMPEDDITEQFSRRIQKYKDDANASMKDAEETAIGDLYAGRPEEYDVYVPPEFSVKEMQRKHDEELKKARKEAILATPDVQERLAPFLAREEIDDYTDGIPNKPKKLATERGRKEMKWWESFMAKNEPIYERTAAFNEAGLALVMRKVAGRKYTVYGEGGESVGFPTLAKLDKWFKANYGKKQVD